MMLPLPALMFVTGSRPLEADRVSELVRGGVNVIQWRDHDPRCDDAAFHVVNSDVDAAVECQAGGIHLKEHGASVAEVRARIGGRTIIGRSVHSVDSAQRAAKEGADYLIAGSIYATRSHPRALPAGTAFLERVCSIVSIPVIAIGGITAERIDECIRGGASGIAASSPFIDGPDPYRTALEYRRTLDAAFAQQATRRAS